MHALTLYLLWPEDRLAAPPTATCPTGYTRRLYRADDAAAYLALISDPVFTAGPDYLRRTLDAALPAGLINVTHEGTGQVVATACALHNPRGGHAYFPFGGELGNVAVHPEHQRRGLGRFVSAMATARLLGAGYTSIRVETQDHRLPALKRYLRLGYVPFLYAAEMAGRWQDVCEHLGWPFTPSVWPTAVE